MSSEDDAYKNCCDCVLEEQSLSVLSYVGRDMSFTFILKYASCVRSSVCVFCLQASFGLGSSNVCVCASHRVLELLCRMFVDVSCVCASHRDFKHFWPTVRRWTIVRWCLHVRFAVKWKIDGFLTCFVRSGVVECRWCTA